MTAGSEGTHCAPPQTKARMIAESTQSHRPMRGSPLQAPTCHAPPWVLTHSTVTPLLSALHLCSRCFSDTAMCRPSARITRAIMAACSTQDTVQLAVNAPEDTRRPIQWQNCSTAPFDRGDREAASGYHRLATVISMRPTGLCHCPSLA